MKRFIFIFLIVGISIQTYPQNGKIDTLIRYLQTAKQDTGRVVALSYLSYQFYNAKPDTALLLAEQGLLLAKKISFPRGEVACLNNLGQIFTATGDYPKALEYLIETLKKSEAIHDDPNIMASLINIGVAYASEGDYRQSIEYNLQALPVADKLHLGRDVGIVLLDQGDNYEKLNMLDSAEYFTKQCYKQVTATKDSDLIGLALNNFGNIYSKLGRNELAMEYYKSDIPYLKQSDDADDFCETYLGMAKLFQKAHQMDSCLYYARLSLSIAKNGGFVDRVMNACNFLTEYFSSKQNFDSAFVYQSAAIVAKDSLFNQEKAREIQNLKFDETIRKQQIEEAKEQAHTELKLNALFGGLFTLFIVAAILYWNNRQKQKAKNKIEKAYADLKSTQAQLIQSEKMASLGELTAGIAHEIQNPLNFVNNFSELNTELLGEMNEEIENKNFDEVKTIAKGVIENQEKINHHGKRAEAIVKGMLQHSRISAGQKELTDINALCDEYVRLTYHGFRTKEKNFNAKLETHFDNSIGKINIVPNEIGRVLLNLINNAFYAVNEKSKSSDISYQPSVSVHTKKSEKGIIITVRDNGNGIPKNISDKIFQPFFTTKPTGQGTGLGLSLSYDIVKTHGGDIKVETKESEGSKFTVMLPC